MIFIFLSTFSITNKFPLFKLFIHLPEYPFKSYTLTHTILITSYRNKLFPYLVELCFLFFLPLQEFLLLIS